MAELVLYGNPQSRSRIVRWMLEEVGEPHRVVVMDYAGALKTPEFLRLNPMGKIPVLTHGETVVTEVAAICAYLADAFPAAGLAPAHGSAARGPYYRWMFFAAGPVEAAATNKVLGVEVSPERERMVGYGNMARVVDVLEHVVSEAEYLAGGAFSAVDVCVGSQIAYGMMFGTIEKRPAFEQYVGRLMARPAAVRAREADEAAMAAGPG